MLQIDGNIFKYYEESLFKWCCSSISISIYIRLQYSNFNQKESVTMNIGNSACN